MSTRFLPADLLLDTVSDNTLLTIGNRRDVAIDKNNTLAGIPELAGIMLTCIGHPECYGTCPRWPQPCLETSHFHIT